MRFGGLGEQTWPSRVPLSISCSAILSDEVSGEGVGAVLLKGKGRKENRGQGGILCLVVCARTLVPMNFDRQISVGATRTSLGSPCMSHIMSHIMSHSMAGRHSPLILGESEHSGLTGSGVK